MTELIQERKRKRKCTSTLSLVDEIAQDCKDAEKAKTTSDAYNYTFKEKVIAAAKKQAELIHREFKGKTELETELRTVAAKIREHFTDKNHKSEATRIITEEFNGKYTRKYTSADYQALQYGKMGEYPECTELALDAIAKLEKAKQIINSDIMPDTVKNDLDDITKDLRHDSVKWAKRNDITWNFRPGDNQESEDQKSSTGKIDRISMDVPPVPKDKLILQQMEKNDRMLIELVNMFIKLREVIQKYPPNDLEVHQNMGEGIKSLMDMIRPYIDKTHQADTPQWIKILTDRYNLDLIRHVNIDYQKLAKQSNIQYNQYSEEEIYKPISIKKHKNGLHPLQDLDDYRNPDGKMERLKLTDKQINTTEIVDLMWFICKNFLFLLTSSEYFRSCQQGYRQKRKKDTHTKQSESAFGRGKN